ncbi:hypothetical protein [Helicobacter cappadocius]|uniref:Uncharacterized protein n=1 Tax=Helicobacter cappadocius TaxID=3063998 RepID=A0AA90PL25_9HELI|nr:MULTISPECIES: hypothetical protein [unclassified Helicobacter]MDO7253488.1 hypothetical protein [Helicobacter sp. faydin-H75]MDP2539415.1 hypothetical protein [Helicobacter sp. faydin-H76]
MESEFIEICKNNGIFTRIVPCALELLYAKDSGIYNQEYNQITNINTDGFEQWLERLKSKNKLDGDNEIILEVLDQIYRKLISIENLINKNEIKLYPLEKKGFISALGHGVICTEIADFEVDVDYYLRFELPVFPKRIVAIFGKAIDRRVVKITKMHQKNIEDFDMYIANKEMENLRLKHNTKDR